MKRYMRIVGGICLIAILILCVMICMEACTKRRSYSLEELQQGLVRVELVKFGWMDGKELSYQERQERGLQDYEVYEVYKTLSEGEMIEITKALENIEFSKLFVQPRWLHEKGIILTYTDKKYYFNTGTVCEIYDDGSFYMLDYGNCKQFDAVIKKYMGDYE